MVAPVPPAQLEIPSLGAGFRGLAKPCGDRLANAASCYGHRFASRPMRVGSTPGTQLAPSRLVRCRTAQDASGLPAGRRWCADSSHDRLAIPMSWATSWLVQAVPNQGGHWNRPCGHRIAKKLPGPICPLANIASELDSFTAGCDTCTREPRAQMLVSRCGQMLGAICLLRQPWARSCET
jgi:hypothetical protein